MSKKYDENLITYLAITDARNKRIPFGIKAKDRTRHIYCIGKTGMGKSTLLENMTVQDIRNGEGFAVIDPHGSFAEKILDYVGEDRIEDVLYFAPFDMDHPISFNVMEDVGYDKRHLVANGLMSAFKKIWVDAWSARMEYILNNVILALLEYPDSTLLGVNRMLADKNYRDKVVENVTDPAVKSFWTDEFAKYGERYMQEAGASIQNKIGQFISNPLVRNIIGQPKSSFDIREMMDNQKIMIINLSKGKVGEENANLLGSMLITKIYLAAMSRADVTPADMKNLPNFYLYVDEFQSFANESFANILSEARKYKLNLTIAHQYVEQMTDDVRAAVFGNVGTMITFRVGSYDAAIFEKEFAPEFSAEDLVNLGFAQIYLKLMIDGVSSKPFSAVTMPPIAPPRFSYIDQIIDHSRKTFGTPRREVEDFIKKWHEDSSASSGGKNKDNKDRGKGDRGNKGNKPGGKRGKVEKTKPFKDAFKSIAPSTPEDDEEREDALRKAISQAYNSGPAVMEEKVEKETTPQDKSAEDISQEERQEMMHLKRPPKDPRAINTKKDASPENIEVLKSALSEVIGENKKDNKKVDKQAPLVSDNKETNSKVRSPKDTEEIPEGDLRKMLEVEENEKD